MSESTHDFAAELQRDDFRLTLTFDLIAPTWPESQEWDLKCRVRVEALEFVADISTGVTSLDLKAFLGALKAAIAKPDGVETALPPLGWYGVAALCVAAGGGSRRRLGYRVRRFHFGEDALAPPELAGDAWIDLDSLGAFRDRLAEIVRILG